MKYDKARVMKMAWAFYRNGKELKDSRYSSFSECLKEAWSIEKSIAVKEMWEQKKETSEKKERTKVSLFELFRNQFVSKVKAGCGTTQCVTINAKAGSFQWVETAWKWFFGGFYWKEISGKVDLAEISEMMERGYLSKKEDTSWKARQLGKETGYALTHKGLRKLYSMYDKWTVEEV